MIGPPRRSNGRQERVAPPAVIRDSELEGASQLVDYGVRKLLSCSAMSEVEQNARLSAAEPVARRAVAAFFRGACSRVKRSADRRALEKRAFLSWLAWLAAHNVRAILESDEAPLPGLPPLGKSLSAPAKLGKQWRTLVQEYSRRSRAELMSVPTFVLTADAIEYAGFFRTEWKDEAPSAEEASVLKTQLQDIVIRDREAIRTAVAEDEATKKRMAAAGFDAWSRRKKEEQRERSLAVSRALENVSEGPRSLEALEAALQRQAHLAKRSKFSSRWQADSAKLRSDMMSKNTRSVLSGSGFENASVEARAKRLDSLSRTLEQLRESRSDVASSRLKAHLADETLRERAFTLLEKIDAGRVRAAGWREAVVTASKALGRRTGGTEVAVELLRRLESDSDELERETRRWRPIDCLVDWRTPQAAELHKSVKEAVQQCLDEEQELDEEFRSAVGSAIEDEGWEDDSLWEEAAPQEWPRRGWPQGVAWERARAVFLGRGQRLQQQLALNPDAMDNPRLHPAAKAAAQWLQATEMLREARDALDSTRWTEEIRFAVCEEDSGQSLVQALADSSEEDGDPIERWVQLQPTAPAVVVSASTGGVAAPSDGGEADTGCLRVGDAVLFEGAWGKEWYTVLAMDWKARRIRMCPALSLFDRQATVGPPQYSASEEVPLCCSAEELESDADEARSGFAGESASRLSWLEPRRRRAERLVQWVCVSELRGRLARHGPGWLARVDNPFGDAGHDSAQSDMHGAWSVARAAIASEPRHDWGGFFLVPSLSVGFGLSVVDTLARLDGHTARLRAETAREEQEEQRALAAEQVAYDKACRIGEAVFVTTAQLEGWWKTKDARAARVLSVLVGAAQAVRVASRSAHADESVLERLFQAWSSALVVSGRVQLAERIGADPQEVVEACMLEWDEAMHDKTARACPLEWIQSVEHEIVSTGTGLAAVVQALRGVDELKDLSKRLRRHVVSIKDTQGSRLTSVRAEAALPGPETLGGGIVCRWDDSFPELEARRCSQQSVCVWSEAFSEIHREVAEPRAVEWEVQCLVETGGRLTVTSDAWRPVFRGSETRFLLAETSPSTAYRLRVRRIVGEEVSKWVYGRVVSTPAICEAPQIHVLQQSPYGDCWLGFEWTCPPLHDSPLFAIQCAEVACEDECTPHATWRDVPERSMVGESHWLARSRFVFETAEAKQPHKWQTVSVVKHPTKQAQVGWFPPGKLFLFRVLSLCSDGFPAEPSEATPFLVPLPPPPRPRLAHSGASTLTLEWSQPSFMGARAVSRAQVSGSVATRPVAQEAKAPPEGFDWYPVLCFPQDWGHSSQAGGALGSEEARRGGELFWWSPSLGLSVWDPSSLSLSSRGQHWVDEARGRSGPEGALAHAVRIAPRHPRWMRVWEVKESSMPGAPPPSERSQGLTYWWDNVDGCSHWLLPDDVPVDANGWPVVQDEALESVGPESVERPEMEFDGQVVVSEAAEGGVPPFSLAVHARLGEGEEVREIYRGEMTTCVVLADVPELSGEVDPQFALQWHGTEWPWACSTLGPWLSASSLPREPGRPHVLRRNGHTADIRWRAASISHSFELWMSCEGWGWEWQKQYVGKACRAVVPSLRSGATYAFALRSVCPRGQVSGALPRAAREVSTTECINGVWVGTC
jgi:hypothetical protein